MKYAIRYYKMYIRESDGCMTSNVASALLFDTVGDAEIYYKDWVVSGKVCIDGPGAIEIVEVQTKIVAQKVIKAISKLNG